jgi:hypothetical protein
METLGAVFPERLLKLYSSSITFSLSDNLGVLLWFGIVGNPTVNGVPGKNKRRLNRRQ